MNRLSDIVVIPLPSWTAATMVVKLSLPVMSAAPFATSVPLFPIAQPISATRRAGASLTPSPVMATISPCAWKALTMRTFWGNSGKDRDGFYAFFQFLLAHGVQFFAGHAGITGLKNTQFTGDGAGCSSMIPGDHHRTNARPAAETHSFLHTLSGRINHADQPLKRKSCFQLFLISGQSEISFTATPITRRAFPAISSLRRRKAGEALVQREKRTSGAPFVIT